MGRTTDSSDPAPGGVPTVADLYAEHEARLHRYAVSLARDPAEADDLIQETFLRAIGSLGLLERLNPYQRRSWLYRVLKNLFLDGQRARQREEVLVQQLAWNTQDAHEPSPNLLTPHLLDRMPELYAEVIELKYFRGMSGEEMARELGIPAATVRSRLHLATKWLRAHQAEYL